MPALSLRQKLLAPLVFCLLALLALTLVNAYQARRRYGTSSIRPTA
jgi:methyl-accepting chemotaxis protein